MSRTRSTITITRCLDTPRSRRTFARAFDFVSEENNATGGCQQSLSARLLIEVPTEGWRPSLGGAGELSRLRPYSGAGLRAVSLLLFHRAVARCRAGA